MDTLTPVPADQMLSRQLSANARQISDAVSEAAAPATSAEDVQVGGGHYKSLRIQPMRYSMFNRLDACQHTIIKYVTRFREKGGIEDLEKAKHAIDLLIEFEKELNA